MVAANDHTHAIGSVRDGAAARSARVRRLARQVAAGRYRVDDEQLAEALIQRARLHLRVRLDLLERSSAR